MENKIKCEKCSEEKSLDSFHSRTRQSGKIYYSKKCKLCQSEIMKEYREKNKDTIKNKKKEYYENNIDKIKEYKKSNSLANKEKIKEKDKKYYDKNKVTITKRNNTYYDKNKEKIKLHRKEFRKNNSEKIKIQKKNYLSNNINAKIASNLRKRTRSFLKTGKYWDTLLDCDISFFKKWLQFNFNKDINENMNFENYGTIWELDHVIPCSSFDLSIEENKKKCFSWKNILPVNKKYNKEKNNKIVKEDIDKLDLRLKEFLNTTE